MDPTSETSTAPPAAETFARLFEAVHEGVYIGVIDPAENATLFANPFLKLMFGFAADAPPIDVRPFETDRFVDPQARDQFLDRLRRDGAVTDYLLRLRRADRTLIWVEVTAHAEDSGGPDELRIEALMRDVSERKRLEDQARDLYQQLLQAEKLAALGQTISGVAHELNNPLATILTWAERLSQRPVDEQTRRGLDTILGESERAAKIVRNLLTFARKRHTTRAMVDLNQVVRETLALRRYEQRLSNISILEAFASGLPSVFADPHQIQQVMLNLIINAEQAMLERQRSRHADHPHLARSAEGRGRPRGARRRAGGARRRAAAHLRSVLHDQGRRARAPDSASPSRMRSSRSTTAGSP